MNIAVLKYQFVSDKPIGVPDVWPAETSFLGESTTLPGENWILMTEEELTTYLTSHQDTYNNWEVNRHLTENKKKRIKEVDRRTQEIISSGFTFDSNQFSLSIEAQINWSGLVTLENLLTWPMNITTKGDGTYALSQSNLLYFIGTGKTVITNTLDSGRTLKISVNNTTTQAALDVIVDSR